MKRGAGIIHEPSGIETLDLESAWIHDWNDKEYVRVGVLEEDAKGEDGVISLILVQFGRKCNALQAALTRDEIAHLIDGLAAAKERLLELEG